MMCRSPVVWLVTISREHMSLRVLYDRSQPSLSGDMCANEKFAELRVTVGTLFW